MRDSHREKGVMRKSTIIAKCLVNSGMFREIEDAEARVLQVFQDEFPNASFLDWNGEIDDSVARRIVTNVGRASRINVAKFIEDLRG
jgi:hypothetical protein